MKPILKHVQLILVLFFFIFLGNLYALEEKETITLPISLSPQTTACVGCHRIYTPGIVQDWLAGRHSKTSPGEALKKTAIERRISSENPPVESMRYTIGCYECHSLNPNSHTDNFNHFGNKINVVVSPDDCRTCHPVEAVQYSGSKKAHAIKNLIDNPVYYALVSTITGVKNADSGKMNAKPPSGETLHETCLGCHGTKIVAKGMKPVSTKIGEIMFPDLAGWPNQGVGRENPDGSLGACTSCHPRHSFSIEVARKPYTCSQCHLEPDVPAWNVYKESKHGNIYFSKYDKWNFNSVPWKLGEDIQSPTCAACHNSLLSTPEGAVISERTHDFGSRLWERLFGLIYSHPQPVSGNTTIIRNSDGLPLPSTFAGEPAAVYLIAAQEKKKRLDYMKRICSTCHSSDWINGHFSKLDNTLKETNEMTLAATKLMTAAWDKGVEDKANPFDGPIEQMWIKQWLFYSNSIRYASAMTGAPDYAAFKNGWWYLTNTLIEMKNMISIREGMEKEKGRD
jgi:hypothetical protein